MSEDRQRQITWDEDASLETFSEKSNRDDSPRPSNCSANTRQAQHGFANFIASEGEEESGPIARTVKEHCVNLFKRWRQRIEVTIGVVVLFNFVLICVDIDYRASGQDSPFTVDLLSFLCFTVYVLELIAMASIEGTAILHNKMNVLDIFVIVIGLLEYILSATGLQAFPAGVFRMFRLSRLLRLVRGMRCFSVFSELRKLVQMMSSCFKTLFWSLLLLFLVQTIWAAIAVELMDDLVKRLADDGTWGDCDRCRRSFSSIMQANLTFFQTIVAGDSWGYIAIPVMEDEPATSVVFVGALLTLVYGVLNLIVAVIVDTFADMRSKDVSNLADEMDHQEKEEKKVLQSIFEKIDSNHNGAVSYAELQSGARKIADFRHWLRVLDIDAEDLTQLFRMVDADGSGEIDPDEFITALYRLKHTESKTATKFVKHYVMKIKEVTDGLASKVNDIQMQMAQESRLSQSRASQLTLGSRLSHFSDGPGPGPRSPSAPLVPSVPSDLSATIQSTMQKACEVFMEAAVSAAAERVHAIMSTAATTTPEELQARLRDAALSDTLRSLGGATASNQAIAESRRPAIRSPGAGWRARLLKGPGQPPG
mmetsp:Transcript_17818/g.39059  ORF Transcript_17818/g.39059 Transcript_17818/m.39059 type:complete len:594 (+) Transcript_17818:104-1885(+)